MYATRLICHNQYINQPASSYIYHSSESINVIQLSPLTNYSLTSSISEITPKASCTIDDSVRHTDRRDE